MKKAYGYVRVSGKGQVKEGGGLKDQEKDIRDYAEKNGYEVVKVFKEKGITGTVEARPALAELMVDLEENGHGIKTVIIQRINRLARKLMVQEIIIGDFQKNGFNLVSVDEGEDLMKGDPTRDMIRQILGSVSEYEKRQLVLKLKAARERERARKGKCEGRKSYSEKNPEILREIKRLRRKHKGIDKRMPFREIAEVLNGQGFTNESGSPFTGKGVHQILARSKA